VGLKWCLIPPRLGGDQTRIILPRQLVDVVNFDRFILEYTSVHGVRG